MRQEAVDEAQGVPTDLLRHIRHGILIHFDNLYRRRKHTLGQALLEAQKAADHEEVPIGAVIVKDGEIIARSYNARELHQKATIMLKSAITGPMTLWAIG